MSEEDECTEASQVAATVGMIKYFGVAGNARS